MICKKCGSEFDDDFSFCPKCGTENKSQVPEKKSPTQDSAANIEDIDSSAKEETRPQQNKFIDQVFDEAEYPMPPKNEVEKHTVKTKDFLVEKVKFILSKINLKELPSKIKTTVCNHKKPSIIIGTVIVALIALLIVASQPKLSFVTVSYEGNQEAGTVLDNDNDGIVVMARYDNGKEKKVRGWTIANPQTLSADQISTVLIEYKSKKELLYVKCNTSAVEEISPKYVGKTDKGTVVTKSNWEVWANYYNSNTENVADKCTMVPEQVTLETDGTYTFSFSYIDPVSKKEFSKDIEIKCTDKTITKLEAKYSGATGEGTEINQQSKDITVTATYKDGTTEVVTGWTMDKPVKLKADETSKMTVKYGGKSCELKVECSTISPARYKSQCKSISYDSLARNPEKYEGQKVKFTGRVVQVMESSFVKVYRINVTWNGYGYYDDTVYVTYFGSSGGRILEDDVVTFYGEFDGLHTYETVLGSSLTIPKVSAKYID